MVRKTNTKSKKGFTIIEVVLVLAIAGLIFLMVFIAFPALQKSQRNTQRRNDYSMLVTAIEHYLDSNNGKLFNLLLKSGTEQNKNELDASRWINGTGLDPSGDPYEVIAIKYSTLCPADNQNKTSCTKPTGTIKYTPATCTKSGTTISAADSSSCASQGGSWTDAVGTPNQAGSQVYVVLKANCNGVDENNDPAPSSDRANRSYAVYGYLEGSGYFCQASGSIGNE